MTHSTDGTEVQLVILSYFDAQELCRFSAACQKWNNIIPSDNKLWRDLCWKKWKSTGLTKGHATWQALYRHHFSKERQIRKSESPGVTAISLALQEAYGVHPDEPWSQHAHYHSPPNKRLQEPVSTITVYSCDFSIPHWHYVTWGLTELNKKNSRNIPDVSGWGFELSFRLAKTEEEFDAEATSAPEWPIHFIQSLARYVTRTGNIFSNGDHMPLSKPLGGDDSKISALLFTHDTILKNEWKNPNGEFDFIQIVGVTEDELESAVAWNKKTFLSTLGKQMNNPLLVTDLRRDSILDDLAVAKMVRERTQQEGSTQGLLFVEKLRYNIDDQTGRMVLELPPLVVPDLVKMLKGRIVYKRDFFLVNSVTDSVVNFVPTRRAQDSSLWQLEETSQLRVSVSQDLAWQLESLGTQVGDYSFPALNNFTLRIVDVA